MDDLTLWHQYQIGKKLLADHLRNGAARELYSHPLADLMIQKVEALEEELLEAAQAALREEVA